MLTCILQARLSSTRLPGKALRPLLGAPMLERQIERMRRATQVSRIVVATSTDGSDDAIERLCVRLGIACVRGDLNDVLGRFIEVARVLPDSHYARSTADCPLIDPGVMDWVIQEHLRTQADYTSNALNPSFPDGLDFEVMTRESLICAHEKAKQKKEREHVTFFIYNHPEIFRLHNVRNSTDLSALRWTVDEPRDFEFVEAVYKELYENNPTFTWKDVLNLLQRKPELEMINRGILRNEGMLKETSHG